MSSQFFKRAHKSIEDMTHRYFFKKKGPSIFFLQKQNTNVFFVEKGAHQSFLLQKKLHIHQFLKWDINRQKKDTLIVSSSKRNINTFFLKRGTSLLFSRKQGTDIGSLFENRAHHCFVKGCINRQKKGHVDFVSMVKDTSIFFLSKGVHQSFVSEKRAHFCFLKGTQIVRRYDTFF